MNRSTFTLRGMALVLGLVATIGAATAAAPEKPRESKDAVKIMATASKPDADGKQTVIITLDILDTWHLYANPVKNEDMTASQTLVKLTSKNKLESAQIVYPAGKTMKDATTGDYDIYEGKVTIKATVRRTKDDNSPLNVSITMSACNSSTCLLPSTVKLAVAPQ